MELFKDMPFRGLTIDEANDLTLSIEVLKSCDIHPTIPEKDAFFNYSFLRRVSEEMLNAEMYEMLADFKKLFELNDVPFILENTDNLGDL